MEGITIATLSTVAIFLLLANVARHFSRLGWKRELRRAVVKERNRNRFGVLRTQLMSDARDNVLDVHSPTFGSLYRGLTVLMREPHAYADAALAILALPSSGSGDEGRQATLAEKKIALAFADALDQLCRDFVRPYRFLAWALDGMERSQQGPNQRRAPHLWVQLASKPAFRDLHQVQQMRNVKRMARATRRLREFGASPAPAPA